MNNLDAILVPGGGVAASGEPHPWVVSRLDYALRHSVDAPIICLSGFTPHKAPPTDSFGFPITEAAAGANYLLSRGFPAKRILTECASSDTIGNAYFCRVQHLEPRGWRRLLVVTSKFHMPRCRAVFETILNLPHDTQKNVKPVDLQFLESPDTGLQDSDLQARLDKEKNALDGWLKRLETQSWKTIASFHEWLFTEHACYAIGKELRREQGVVLKSY
ncbi:MAG: hypothetical protein RLY70_1864 [Planctomycetota bacterium]